MNSVGKMYTKFYGLNERPFNVTSDPAFFYLSRKHQEALAHLYYGISQRKGILVVTGEIGTGKTTLCRFFLNKISENIKTAFILNTFFSTNELLEAIVKDFGITAWQRSSLSFINELNKFLLKESRNGNNVVLIIDEAQNLSEEQLEQVRLLSNLETEKDKLIQIVLSGQPELHQKLNLHSLRQLNQRIMVRYHISSLEEDEVRSYIEHRLQIAGSSNELHFNDEAVSKITSFSKGVPRLINILCDRALLAGFVEEKHTIDLPIVDKCIREINNHNQN
ncbi:MAG: ATPase [Candidatus Omnitrophota bacterium]|nr:MAG: ATPase [Candidatus Omnitrophota bacterium]